MISTNGPQGLTAHNNNNDLNISGTSDDEDLGEDGGRLIIDDSGPECGGSNGSSNGSGPGARPTRCGNIQNRTYMCSECSFTTTNARQCLEHRKSVHKHDLTIYSCNLCQYATQYKQKLPRHYKLHFPASATGDLPAEGQVNPRTHALRARRPPPHTSLTSTPTQGGSALTTPTSLPTIHPSPANSSGIPSSPGRGLKRSAEEAAGLISPSVLPSEVILEDGEEEEEEEVVESDPATPPPGDGDVDGEVEGEGLASAAAALEPPAKKKRKDVSPDKYFEVAEEVAYTKYGCAKCGNVYKWKKSLNKHWKEKHGNDPGDSQYTPPGMLILLQQNNHVQTEHRRCCHKTFLEQITVKHNNTASRPHTPHNFLNGHYNGGQLSSPENDDVDGEEPGSLVPVAASGIPAGPFVLGTSSQPVFPTMGQRQSLLHNLHAPIPSSSSNVLDLTTSHTSLDETDSVGDSASRPLDFSVSKTKTPPPPSSSSSLTPRPSTSSLVTAEEDQEVSALNELQQASSSRDSPGKGGGSLLKCPKCGEVLKTQTAYSNHLSMHFQSANKKVAKCGVCQTHFPNNDALNNHFMDRHMDLITSHKEAIQKIPHGLQQTYHLLKMPLHTISKLSTSETDDPLKCNMCEFTAKWPAELQKHAVSHSDERPFVCMVCGSTYKWKWDLVKHFEKAHSNLPNPYKRREAGAATAAPAGPLEAQGGLSMSGGAEFELEDGEMSLLKMKDQGGVDAAGSFLFRQSPAQDDSSVENLLRTSQQASLMMSRQPNFLDSPENTQASACASPGQDSSNGGGERVGGFDLSALQALSLPSTSSGLSFSSSGSLVLSENGQENRPSRHGAIRSGRVHVREADQPYPSLSARPRSGGKNRSSNKGYKTVEGSEASDLKYQCLQCEYKARWPSEIMQHMKNHSTEKPYGCPNCTYRSKWKWDVVKHLKRCGKGGTIKDVIDYNQRNVARDAPPNVMVTPEGSVVQTQQAASPQPGPSTSSEGNAPLSLPSEAQTPSSSSSFLPSLVSSPSSAPAVPLAAMTPQDYVTFIYQQHSKAVSEALNSAVAAGAGAGSAGPSSSEPVARAESPGPQQAVTYSSLINQGQHHCLHCTHVAGSVAELRRHQVTHSEEKPFTCDECSYSTKWKCDMKKHKEKYKHHGPIRVLRPGAEAREQDSKQGGHRCPHCPFETNSAEALQTHLKREHPPTKKSPQGPKFRCKKCPFATNELGDWINHRRQHQKDQEDSGQPPSVNGAREVDEARLKHPRKPVKKHHCNECSFTCLQSRELMEHMASVHGAYGCAFCKQHCDTQESFLDHLLTHPDKFHPNEWGCYFTNTSDNEDVNNNTDTPPAAEGRKAKVQVVDTGSSANTIDLTSTSLPTPVLMAAPTTTPQPPAPAPTLPCQWCDARFANVVRLYSHVSQMHPQQKRQQEIAEGLKTSPPPGLFQPLAKSGKQLAPSLVLSKEMKALVQQQQQQQHGAGKTGLSSAKLNGRLSGLNSGLQGNISLSLLQTPAIMAQLGHPAPSTSTNNINNNNNNTAALSLASSRADTGLNLSTKKPEEKQPRVFQCIKCPYRSHLLEAYMEHLPTHDTPLSGAGPSVGASKPQEARGEETLRCIYCEDSLKSFVELWQHLQTQHAADIATRPDRYLEFLQICFHVSKRPELGRVDPNPQPLTSAAAAVAAVAATSAAIAGHDPTTSSSTTTLPSFLHRKKLLTYNGCPLQVLRLPNSSEVWYKCAVCNFMDRLPDNISKHTRQVPHATPSKFQCAICGYSNNAVKTVMHHHEAMHPTQPPSIAVIELEEITVPSPQTLRENSTGFTPSPASPLALSAALSAAGPGQAVAGLHTPVIKKERSSYSPPQAASTPNDPPQDCCPLDLSAESAEDRPLNRRAASTERNPPPPPAAENAAQRMVGDAGDGSEAEVQEVKEAEAGTSSHPGKMSSSRSEVEEEGEESQLPKFQCKLCPFSCRSNYEFRKHCSCHGVKSRYPCDYCTFSHDQLPVLSQHRNVHSGQRGFNPVYTPKPNPPPSSSPSEDTRIVSPVPPPSVPETLRCRNCPYRTTERKAFSIHSAMHGRMCQYICDFCDWSTDRLTILVQHRTVHSADPDFDPSPEDHVFANPEYVQMVSGEFQAKLLDSRTPEEQRAGCSSSSSSPSQYKLSITKRSLTCPDCPYVTHSKQAFAFHASLHQGPGCYPCALCSYRTHRWSLLCQHNRLHEESSEQEPEETDQAPAASPAAPSSAVKQEERVGTPSAKADGAAVAAAEEEEEPQPVRDATAADTEDIQSVDTPEGAEDNNDSSPACDKAGTAQGGKGEEEEVQCERCPFRTSSKLLLKQHVQHHGGSGQVVCPCCDFTCPSQDTLLTHIQLHFPSVPVDMPALQHMLDKQQEQQQQEQQQQEQQSQGESKKAATDSSGQDVVSSDKADSESVSGGQDGEERSAGSQQLSAPQPAPTPTPAPTKVYACRYCDLEFEDKERMIQHERQHQA